MESLPSKMSHKVTVFLLNSDLIFPLFMFFMQTKKTPFKTKITCVTLEQKRIKRSCVFKSTQIYINFNYIIVSLKFSKRQNQALP